MKMKTGGKGITFVAQHMLELERADAVSVYLGDLLASWLDLASEQQNFPAQEVVPSIFSEILQMARDKTADRHITKILDDVKEVVLSDFVDAYSRAKIQSKPTPSAPMPTYARRGGRPRAML
jgi:hypothetical protein